MNLLVETLASARVAGAGWGYAPGSPSRVEPTAYALLALAAYGRAIPDEAVAWLTSSQGADGSWGAADGPWVTALAVFALAKLDGEREAQLRGEAWLLRTRSEVLPDADPMVLGTNPALVGWPWTVGCFGWVEPTAHALIALRAARRRDQRLHEAARFLFDRRCEGGGWNHGVGAVGTLPLVPYPYTTALALIALAAPGRQNMLERDLGVLSGFLQEPLGVFDLAWTALALDACGADAEPALAKLRTAIGEVQEWRENLHALALAALADAGPTGARPFRLPA